MNGQTSNQPKSGPPGGSQDIGVLLGVWAHPDDEAYLTAGPMSVVRAAGHQVAGATATKGGTRNRRPGCVTTGPARVDP
jgi:GlcNAc-PI de-N-acetylase.